MEHKYSKIYNGYKMCSSCKCLLPLVMFSRLYKGNIGLQSWCKTCLSEHERKMTKKILFSKCIDCGEIIPGMSERCEDCKEVYTIQSRYQNYYHNQELMAKRNRKFRENNPNYMKEYGKKYRKLNPKYKKNSKSLMEKV